ncbi:MAG: type II secretion system F family protein [Planctomycetota bacterium]
MIEAVLVAAFVGLVAVLVVVLRGAREKVEDNEVAMPERFAGQRRATLAGAIVGIALAVGLVTLLGSPIWIGAAAGLLAFVIGRVVATVIVARREARIELRLADAIDLLVSALRAGSSLPEALDSAALSARTPGAETFEELSDRVRVGEPHESVLADIDRRFDLESVRVFTFTLAAHWEGGGSLATSLSNVGRSIRDRVDVTRRVQSQSIETQASVVGVLVITYGLALLMWSNYPARVETFVGSDIGSMFIALSIALQAIGLVWISSMTRVEV